MVNDLIFNMTVSADTDGTAYVALFRRLADYVEKNPLEARDKITATFRDGKWDIVHTTYNAIYRRVG